MEAIAYFLPLLAALGAFVIGGYGLLKLGHLINIRLNRDRNQRWIIYVAGVLGLGLFFAEYLIAIDHEWSRALGALLLVLALVTLINYRGK